MISKILTIFVFFIFLFSGNAQNEEADRLLKNMVAEKGIVGIAASYSVAGELKWQNADGYSDLKNKTPYTETTLNRTASIAKSMTAIAVMQLFEQDLIDLDLPIQTYIKDFPKKPQGEITTRNLLAHTSGIDGYKSAKEAETQQEFATLSEAVDVFKDRELRFEPGTDFYYTTYGYVLLGLLIEKVSGLPYGEYMQKNIWDKADMTETGIEKFTESYNHKSSLYHYKKRKAKEAKKNNLSNRIPGGGFYSNLDDLIKFGNAVLDNRLIKESTFTMMIENQFPGKEGNPYAFGWFLYGPKPNENVVIGHSGEQTGAASQLMIIPKSKTVVAVLANTSGTWREVVMLSSQLIQLSETDNDKSN